MSSTSNQLKRRLTRRALLRALTFGGAALLAACAAPAAAPSAPAATTAPAQSAATEAPAATTAPAAPVATEAPAAAPATSGGTPKPGGTYRALFGGEVPNLDAAIAFGWEDFWASYFLLFNRLYTYNSKNEFEPVLAADMPKISTDGKTYTVPLRKGVKFHDGSELTAEDVKFTFDRTLDPALKSPAAGFNVNILGADDVAAGKTKELSGVKVIDPYTVEFTLKEPQSVFSRLQSMASCQRRRLRRPAKIGA